jgi:hypothetical protein
LRSAVSISSSYRRRLHNSINARVLIGQRLWRGLHGLGKSRQHVGIKHVGFRQFDQWNRQNLAPGVG